MSRHAKHPRADHRAAAEGLREMPGVWLLVGTYRLGNNTPRSLIHAISKGQHGYSPAGAFEARTEPVGDEAGLLVRYVGQAEQVAA